ncbi:hypothetical protein V5O48_009202 [Marasmius crinis-equi]|uniref:Uncharacterized protein n=1 Tax=Marasmius crinis-equi TaxID=585013 RepID=A0ABR3FBW0_9AGAR
MRYLTPTLSRSSSQTLSSNQTARNVARDSRREGLARIQEDGAVEGTRPSGVLAAVVSSRRLRAYETPANLLSTTTTPKAPRKLKTISTAVLMEDSAPFSYTTFDEWYHTLTLEKRRALMVSMREVCKERDAAQGAKMSVEVDPSEIAFQARVEDDKDGLVLQFNKWYTSLNEVQQNNALAYSALTDGQKVDDLPTEQEAEDENKENQQVARPFVREPSFVEGSSSRATPRDAESDPKSTAAKGKGKRLTREASSELFSWAQSYVQDKPVVVPQVPVAKPPRVLQPVDEDDQAPIMVNYELPKPPKRGYRAKITRTGTLILDGRGKPIFEKIPQKYQTRPEVPQRD